MCVVIILGQKDQILCSGNITGELLLIYINNFLSNILQQSVVTKKTTVQSDSSHLLINSDVIGTRCLQPQNSQRIFYQNIIDMMDFITNQDKNTQNPITTITHVTMAQIYSHPCDMSIEQSVALNSFL